MNLGYIDYLNCFPFYYHMFEKERIKDINIVPGYPSIMNSMMLSGGLDMSPISAGAYPELYGNSVMVPDYCLSSLGYVGSVNLISKIPIEDLSGKKVGLTSASKTSVVLLKVLLEKFYGVQPDYVQTAPFPDMDNLDAALLIGNEAMLPQKSRPISFTYDLGALWLHKTGFPVVFSVFVVQKNAVKTYRDKIADIIQSYRKSVECMKTEKNNIVRKAGERYPDIPYDIDFYYSLFTYDFTDNLKKALEYYLKLGAETGLLEKTEGIEWLNL